MFHQPLHATCREPLSHASELGFWRARRERYGASGWSVKAGPKPGRWRRRKVGQTKSGLRTLAGTRRAALLGLEASQTAQQTGVGFGGEHRYWTRHAPVGSASHWFTRRSASTGPNNTTILHSQETDLCYGRRKGSNQARGPGGMRVVVSSVDRCHAAASERLPSACGLTGVRAGSSENDGCFGPQQVVALDAELSSSASGAFIVSSPATAVAQPLIGGFRCRRM
jgi:hypothetical protein